MKKIKVEDAIGLTLCHDLTAMYDGFKGPLFKRGHIIKEEDVEKMLNIGKKHVFVWADEEGEIHEEDCAKRLSAGAQVKGAHYSDISEGKTVLISDTEGLFRVNRNLLNRVNSIGDITISTLPDHYPVKKGDRLASMRIVPLVTKVSRIEEYEEMCKKEKLLDILPYNYKKVGVIITGSEIYNGRIKDKFEPVVREKLKKFPSEITDVKICDDDLEMIVSAAKKMVDDGVQMLIFTGGMSVDPDDLTPTAVKRLGADIVSHGVPSQPGNMTLMAYLGNIPVIGVPGAAISMPTTIFDVLLPQMFTDEKITKENLVNLGDGGLCQLCEKCRFPNCSFGRY